MTGMPQAVKEDLEGNRDIPGCSTAQWEKHLIHHIKRHRAKRDENKQATESAQIQLLKLQLEDLGKR